MGGHIETSSHAPSLALPMKGRVPFGVRGVTDPTSPALPTQSFPRKRESRLCCSASETEVPAFAGTTLWMDASWARAKP